MTVFQSLRHDWSKRAWAAWLTPAVLIIGVCNLFSGAALVPPTPRRSIEDVCGRPNQLRGIEDSANARDVPFIIRAPAERDEVMLSLRHW
jgi:hypothetical protein